MNNALTLEQAVGQRLMLAFAGKDRPSTEALHALRHIRPAGFTLYRHLNIDNPAQVRELTRTLQDAARKAGLPPLLIAADQEGGQLMAIGNGMTELPGNMALGAAGSTALAQRAGEVLGRELAAIGININYAPCADVNINPLNPVIGVRSFGEDPQKVSELTAAMVAGIQGAGVAATAKHFPGHGDTAADSHHAIPVIPHGRDRLDRVELPPFEAAIRAEVGVVMTGHLALPSIDRVADLPATLSPAILRGLLREEMGFRGVIITDAMDMRAIGQGAALGDDAVRAAAAGADLLLLPDNAEDQQRVYTSLLDAIQHGRLDENDTMASAQRVLSLKQWLASQPARPDLDVVGCLAHRQVASDIAAASITLVRDNDQLLPLQPDQRVAVVLPTPRDLTPADTSSYVKPLPAQSMRVFLPNVREITLPSVPQDRDISFALQQIESCDRVIVGTINAASQPEQAALVRALLATEIPTIVVALRLPYDLVAFPQASTYICTYSILQPSLDALARALCSRADFTGSLPVSIPGLYSIGHGLYP